MPWHDTNVARFTVPSSNEPLGSHFLSWDFVCSGAGSCRPFFSVACGHIRIEEKMDCYRTLDNEPIELTTHTGVQVNNICHLVFGRHIVIFVKQRQSTFTPPLLPCAQSTYPSKMAAGIFRRYSETCPNALWCGYGTVGNVCLARCIA